MQICKKHPEYIAPDARLLCEDTSLSVKNILLGSDEPQNPPEEEWTETIK